MRVFEKILPLRSTGHSGQSLRKAARRAPPILCATSVVTYVTNSHTRSRFCRSISGVQIQRETRAEGTCDAAQEASGCGSRRHCGHGWGMVAAPQNASARLADTTVGATFLTSTSPG